MKRSNLFEISKEELEFLMEKARFVIDFENNEIKLNKQLMALLGNPRTVSFYYNQNGLVIVPNGTITLYTYNSSIDRKYYTVRSENLIYNIKRLYCLTGKKDSSKSGKKYYRVGNVRRGFLSTFVEVRIK